MHSLTAADVMTAQVLTMTDTHTVREVVESMRERMVTGVPIVDAGGRAVGVVSQNDVARAVALAAERGEDERQSVLSRRVRDFMTPVVWSCGPETPLATICDLMVQRRIHRVVVCDDARRVVGIITALDVVRLFRDELAEAPTAD